MDLTRDGWRRIQSWNDFNNLHLQGLELNDDFMKPWSGRATCRNYDHNAPNPYCSCGYYSIKKFGVWHVVSFLTMDKRNISRFNTNVTLFARLNKQNEYEQKTLLNSFLIVQLLKHLEMKNFALVGEVALRGVIIECEKGYRSQFVEARKVFLLLQFETLLGICRYLGQIINKDEAAEAITQQYEWAVYIE